MLASALDTSLRALICSELFSFSGNLLIADFAFLRASSALWMLISEPISALLTRTITSSDSISAKPPIKAIDFHLEFILNLKTPISIAVTKDICPGSTPI